MPGDNVSGSQDTGLPGKLNREDAPGPPMVGRAVARLMAVQALFQMEASGSSLEEVRTDFSDPTFSSASAIEGHELAEIDRDHFDVILSRAVDDQPRIDQATDCALVERWPIDRIDPILRAVFRAAGAELLVGRVPPKVVINEFVDVTKAFFPGSPEPGFANAVLDHMARHLASP